MPPPGALARRARRPALQAVAQRAGPLGSRRALGSTPSISGSWAFGGVNLLKGATSKYLRCAPPPAPETAPRRTELPNTLAKRFPRPSPDVRAVCAARCRLAIFQPLARAVAGRWHATIARSDVRVCTRVSGTAARGARSTSPAAGPPGSSAARGAAGPAQQSRIDVVDLRAVSRLARAWGPFGGYGPRLIVSYGRTL